MKQTMAVSREQYLSKEQTVVLKGLLALGVLLAHTVPASGLVYGSVLSTLIGSLGYLCVAVFFFLSGYGIMAQYQAKKEQYLKNFLKNRVLSLYLLTLFLVLLYGIFRIIVSVQIPLMELLQSFLIGNTIVSNGWYLQVVLLFYVFWYLTVKYVPEEKGQLCMLSVLVIGYMIFGVFQMARFWYQSSLGFLLGVFWQQNKQRLDEWLFQKKKHLVLGLTLAVIAFTMTYLLSIKGGVTNASYGHVFRAVMSCFAAVAFVIVVLISDMLFGNLLNCGVLRFLGKFSMEIYVLQGIPLHIFKMRVLKIENGWLYMVGVIAATILLSIAMHPVIQFVTNIPKKYFKRG